MDEDAARGAALGLSLDSLVRIGLGRQVQGVGRRVDDAGGDDADVGVDVETVVQVGGEERNVEIPLGDDLSRLGVDLVDVVLGRRVVDILSGISGGRVHEGLREGLLLLAHVVAGECCPPKLAELGASHDGRVHIMITDAEY